MDNRPLLIPNSMRTNGRTQIGTQTSAMLRTLSTGLRLSFTCVALYLRHLSQLSAGLQCTEVSDLLEGRGQGNKCVGATWKAWPGLLRSTRSPNKLEGQEGVMAHRKREFAKLERKRALSLGDDR